VVLTALWLPEFSEQVVVCSSEQLHLPGLDLVDGALYRTGVVLLGQPGVDGLEVAAQPDGERAQRRQVVIDGGHPCGQLVLIAGQVLDHASESGHMVDGGVDLGASGPYRLQSCIVGGVEMAGQAGDPCGDLPHRRRPVPQNLGERGRVAAAQRLQVALDGVVAAGVALFDDLGVQRGSTSHTGRDPLPGQAGVATQHSPRRMGLDLRRVEYSSLEVSSIRTSSWPIAAGRIRPPMLATCARIAARSIWAASPDSWSSSNSTWSQ